MSAAVRHILRQMQRDPRLAWLIGPGSRTFELLAEEACEFPWESAEWQKAFEATLKFEPWPNTLGLQIDPEAILLARATPEQTYWFDRNNRYYNSQFSMERIHGNSNAPLWRGYEKRKAALGFEEWTSSYRFYVCDDFGKLVEVPAP